MSRYSLILKANKKYMKGYDKNKELSYLKYCNINNSYGCPNSCF